MGVKKLQIPHSSSFLYFNSDLNIFSYTVFFNLIYSQFISGVVWDFPPAHPLAS